MSEENVVQVLQHQGVCTPPHWAGAVCMTIILSMLKVPKTGCFHVHHLVFQIAKQQLHCNPKVLMIIGGVLAEFKPDSVGSCLCGSGPGWVMPLWVMPWAMPSLGSFPFLASHPNLGDAAFSAPHVIILGFYMLMLLLPSSLVNLMSTLQQPIDSTNSKDR